MFKKVLQFLIGREAKKLAKSVVNSDTTRTVATASVSTLVFVRAICAFFAELGWIPAEMSEDTALIISAVLIPFVSRLLAFVRSKF